MTFKELENQILALPPQEAGNHNLGIPDEEVLAFAISLLEIYRYFL